MSEWSVDYWFYKYLYEPLSRQLCFIHPNYITIANLFMLIPIAYGLLHRWSLGSIIALAFVRGSLDCLDGAVARSCNKTSEFGKYLDIAVDNISVIILLFVISYIIVKNHSFTPKTVGFISMFLAIIAAAAYCTTTLLQNNAASSKFVQFIHDNTVLHHLTSATIAWSIVRV